MAKPLRILPPPARIGEPPPDRGRLMSADQVARDLDWAYDEMTFSMY